MGFDIGDVMCPTRYETDSSSINPVNSLMYRIGVLKTSLEFRLQRMVLLKHSIFSPVESY